VIRPEEEFERFQNRSERDFLLTLM